MVNFSVSSRLDAKPSRKPLAAEIETTDVAVTVQVSGDQPLSDAALSAIYRILHKETERIAQIAAVDRRDQVIARIEADRIAKLPKDRPSIIAGVGSKDPESVIVERGSWKIGGKTLSAPKR